VADDVSNTGKVADLRLAEGDGFSVRATVAPATP